MKGKEKNNKEKQLHFIERFLKTDKELHSQFRYISREIPRRYDTPKLLKEKEIITKELKTKKIFLYSSLIIILPILVVLIFLYNKSKKAEKLHRKIAQDLIQSVHKNNSMYTETSFVEERFAHDTIPQENTRSKGYSNISEDLSQTLLKELEKFEINEHFLVTGITLGTLAKKLKTNSKYLSEVINNHKGKNFAAYLNDLRIDYAIKRLAEDKKFRSYKISSIAEELGYNTEQAFTLAFKKRTGTPLSIYLKEIEKTKE